MIHPAYLDLPAGVLAARARRAIASLEDCRACPRDCRVNRLADHWSACKTGRYAIVSSAFPHLGEEDCLRGWNGSGTIFFAHCNLRCVFCQNYDISQAIRPGSDAAPGSPPHEIARMMLDLETHGCHNINFVTPEHVVPQILEALLLAAEQGLRLPLVYNTGAYDALESIELLDGVVDIYMPDFKVWSPERARVYLKAEDYPERARAAIRAMHEQVGPLRLDENGLARRGVLIRHLVMPGMLDETRAILTWIARELGPETYVNLMDQYHPAGKVGAGRAGRGELGSGRTGAVSVASGGYVEIDRPITSAEAAGALAMARDLGLRRLDERRPRAKPVRART